MDIGLPGGRRSNEPLGYINLNIANWWKSSLGKRAQEELGRDDSKFLTKLQADWGWTPEEIDGVTLVFPNLRLETIYAELHVREVNPWDKRCKLLLGEAELKNTEIKSNSLIHSNRRDVAMAFISEQDVLIGSKVGIEQVLAVKRPLFEESEDNVRPFPPVATAQLRTARITPARIKELAGESLAAWLEPLLVNSVGVRMLVFVNEDTLNIEASFTCQTEGKAKSCLAGAESAVGRLTQETKRLRQSRSQSLPEMMQWILWQYWIPFEKNVQIESRGTLVRFTTKAAVQELPVPNYVALLRQLHDWANEHQ